MQYTQPLPCVNFPSVRIVLFSCMTARNCCGVRRNERQKNSSGMHMLSDSRTWPLLFFSDTYLVRVQSREVPVCLGWVVSGLQKRMAGIFARRSVADGAERYDKVVCDSVLPVDRRLKARLVSPVLPLAASSLQSLQLLTARTTPRVRTCFNAMLPNSETRFSVFYDRWDDS